MYNYINFCYWYHSMYIMGDLRQFWFPTSSTVTKVHRYPYLILWFDIFTFLYELHVTVVRNINTLWYWLIPLVHDHGLCGLVYTNSKDTTGILLWILCTVIWKHNNSYIAKLYCGRKFNACIVQFSKNYCFQMTLHNVHMPAVPLPFV